MDKNTYQLNLANLFKAVGIDKTGTVTITEHTHDFDPDFPKDHWVYASLLGFKQYYKKYGNISSFASVGVGPGVETIGACEILKPTNVTLTDIHPKIPEVARANVCNNVSNDVDVNAFQGDLCQPLIQNNLKFDLIYANIPNIPSDELRLNKKDSASFYKKRDDVNCPKIFDDYLLTLQYQFLKEARHALEERSAVIDAIGGRLPYEILQSLFTSNGYRFEELVSVFKIQTEPEYVLKGYAEAEENNQIEFDFYNYEEAQNFWLKIEKLNLKGPELKEVLKPFRVNAKTAYKNYLINKKRAGHVVHILCGRV